MAIKALIATGRSLWKLNGVVISNDAHFTGQGTASLDVANLNGSHAGLYTVEISNAAGTTISLPAGLSVFTQVGFELDSTFPAASFAIASSGSVRVRAIAPTGDGGAIIGGDFTFNKTGGGTIENLARIKPDGTIDETFSPNPNNFVFHIIVLDNGNILISGSFSAVNGVAAQRFVRLTAAGATDMEWDLSSSSFIYTHARRSDGKYVVGGGFAQLGESAAYQYVGLLDAEGTPEPGLLFFTFNSQVEAIALQNDNLIVGGAFNNTNPDRLVRLNYAVTPTLKLYAQDVTFNQDMAGPSGTVHDLAVPTDINDGIFVAGSQFQYNGTSRTGLAKVDKDGALDTTFNPALSFRARAVALLGGQVLVGGQFTTAGGQTANRIAMLNQDTGALAKDMIDFGTGASSTVYKFAQAGSHTFIGGDFVGINGDTKLKGLARISGGADSPLSLAILGQPVGATVTEGATVTLSVAATGNGALNFQWKKGTEDVPGATGSSLTIMNATTGDAGDYMVTVTDADGGAGIISSTATVTVMAGPQTYAQYAAGIDWMGQDSSPGGDADKDGIKNIAEFAFGSSPTTNTSGELPQGTVKDDMGTVYPAVTFIRDTNVADVTITVQAALEVDSMNMLSTVETTEDLGNGLQRVTVRVTTPASATTQVYFRCNVTLN